MLQLNRNDLNKKEEWVRAGVNLPSFDLELINRNTKERPEWVHFGAGNIFRAFVATSYQKLLDQGLCDTGIIAVETFDEEVIEKIYKPYDNLSLDVSISGRGEFDLTLVASISEALIGSVSVKEDWQRLEAIFTSQSLKMASFTVTEKGYAVLDSSGQLIPLIQNDLENGLKIPVHLISKLILLLIKRYEVGKYPLALVSMDNCSQNGAKLRQAVFAVAEKTCELGFIDKGFIDYVNNENLITFPWSMIDKITPRPSEDIKQSLAERGIDNLDIVVTTKHTYMAPFVNSEQTQYLFIENQFPNGSLLLDQTQGIWLTDRDTVNAVETMKVTTCLNPLHTAIAIFGRLLGLDLVKDAVKDPDIKKLVERIGYLESLPVVKDPGIIKPKDFLDEVLNSRFSNPYIPDTTARIASDTSLKLGIRYGETIKSYLESNDLDVTKLVGIPLVIAAWCRYLIGKDDQGHNLVLSPDPNLEQLQQALSGATIGSKSNSLTSILSNAGIFGLDLYQIGLGTRIESMFDEMLQEPGAVRRTLHRWLNI